MDRKERRKRTGQATPAAEKPARRALPAAAAAGNAVKAAADEIRLAARSFRLHGIDNTFYLKDGAPTVRTAIAKGKIERDKTGGGKGLLVMLAKLFRG